MLATSATQPTRPPCDETPRPDPPWTLGAPCLAPDEGLHEAVARIARSRPDALAVVSGDRRLSYAELDATADAWAASLVSAGARPGDLVPVVLHRGPELVIALVAVLKAGAAYAALDADWPERRRRDVLQQLGPPLVVAAAGSAAPPQLLVWTPPDVPGVVPDWFRPARTAAALPCSVFFTSGTTGRPKGVVSPHRATARLFQCNSFADFTARTIMPLAAAVAWDAFSLELWSVLLNGGTSVVVEEPYLSVEALRAGIHRHRINTVWLTSTLFTMLVDEDLDAFTGLMQVLIGGERLSPAHVGAFLRRHPNITLINGYGPVESTVFATTHTIRPEDVECPGGIPLGRPVPGTQVVVLAGERPCGPGEVGEIAIAGAGLATGYLDDPALTDEKFVHLRLELDGEKLRFYRSGDLGLVDAEGVLHYRGRADRQVKIRGHRVEPAEVERQVEISLPAVRECRVLPRSTGDGTATELVAFCLPVEAGDPMLHATAVLQAELVAHHRPAVVVSVRSLPLTSQGKLDEAALLALAPAAGRRKDPVRTGQSDEGGTVLRVVRRVFGEVLGTAGVPLDVPFFELGGNSLAAGRVCARLDACLARPVSVSLLYRHPTARALADQLRRPQRPVRTGLSRPAEGVPLTDLQLVHLTRHLVAPDDRSAHCLLVWSVDGFLDRSALQSAIDAVHLRHEPLSAVYVADPRPAAWLDDVPPPELLALTAQPSVDDATQALRAVLAEALDPTVGQIWRAAVVPVADSDVTLFGCAVHHIAFDGWSEGVLAKDLSAAYAVARGRPVQSAPFPPSLDRLHAVPEGRAPGRDGDLALLRSELAGVPAMRWPAGPIASAPSPPEHCATTLPPAVVARADADAARAGATRFELLLNRWACSLAVVTGQDDFAIGVPVAQRDRAGIQNAVGCHITTVCLRMRGSVLGGGTLDRTGAGLGATARLVRGALATQDVPFSEVMRFAGALRGDRPPLFQTLFALQDNDEPRLELDGLRCTFLRQPYLQLPLELHAELWPAADGSLRVEIAFRPDMVPAAVAHNLLELFSSAMEGCGELP